MRRPHPGRAAMWILKRLLSWWWGHRVPETEAMDCEDEVAAYVDASTQRYLSSLDEEAARRAAPVFERCRSLIDLGCGPASIPLSVADRVPGLMIMGVDLSLPMLQRARQEAERRGMRDRLLLVCASSSALPFRGASFDGVCSNSLLHHLERPQLTIGEASRVVPSGAPMFLRDLRRPPRFLLRIHLAIYGHRYGARMRELFCASVRAAYTRRELADLVQPLEGARVILRGGAHVEVVRGDAE